MFVTVKRHPEFAGDVFEREISRLFNSNGVAGSTFEPAMDIAEDENAYVLVLDMPGVKKDSLKLNVEDGVLSISGERKEHQLAEKASWIRNEIRTGSFTRTVKLSKNIDIEKISADLNDGVLKVQLPKAEAAKPRTITIN